MRSEPARSNRTFGAAIGLAIVLLVPRGAWAVPASPQPFDAEQPNGRHVRLHLRGDEHFHWLEDEDGYTVVRQDGAYVYARLDSRGRLEPTTLPVGSASPSAHGLARRMLPAAGVRGQAGDTPRTRQELSPGGLDGPPATTGTLRNLVVILRFADHRTRPLPSRTGIDKLWNAAGGHPVLAPTGSLRDLLLENSYGALRFDSTVVGWVDLPETESHYAGGTAGIGAAIWEAIRDALDRVDRSIDLREFDGDHDGYVDAIAFMHSGYGAEFGGTDAYGADYTNRIWSHASSMPTWMSTDGVRVRSYQITSALWGLSGRKPAHIGVIGHETGHVLGLPDLYDTDGSSAGTGSYCLMSDPWGFTGDQLNPPHLSAWAKSMLGWLTPVRVEAAGVFTVPEVETSPTALRIDAGYPDGEYLLVENREPVGLERTLPQGGLAIWHVDERTHDNDDEGYPGQAGWPQNGRHYRVALLQADGRYDLERGSNGGDPTDLYHASGVSALGPTSLPSTDAYQDGFVASTGNRLSQIGPAGTVMTFQLSNDCTFALSRTGESFPTGGGEGSLAVFATGTCGWTASSSQPWLAVTSDTRGRGDGMVTFSVDVNTTMGVRQATLSVAGQAFTVTQAGDMHFIPLTNGVAIDDTLDAAAAQAAWKYYYLDVPAGAGNLSVDLEALTADADLYVRFGSLPTLAAFDCRSDLRSTAGERCTFASAAPGRWWIGVTDRDVGPIGYAVRARYAVGFPLPAPSGLHPGGPDQDSAAEVTTSPVVLAWDPVDGAWRYDVLVYVWDVDSRTWMLLPTAYTTDPEIAYVLPIEEALYAWTVRTVGSDGSSVPAPFAFVQYRPSACRFVISPASASVGSHGGSGTVSVTAAPECSWTATSSVDWITVVAGDVGTGSGRVGYRVTMNTTLELRTGTIAIADQTFMVTQRAGPRGHHVRHGATGEQRNEDH